MQGILYSTKLKRTHVSNVSCTILPWDLLYCVLYCFGTPVSCWTAVGLPWNCSLSAISLSLDRHGAMLSPLAAIAYAAATSYSSFSISRRFACGICPQVAGKRDKHVGWRSCYPNRSASRCLPLWMGAPAFFLFPRVQDQL
jgi:hypothetical protein